MAQLMVAVPFMGVLRPGSVGTQPVAVKRALWRAGYRDGWEGLDSSVVSARVLGPTAVHNLIGFQAAQHLDPDGVYGPMTHALLSPNMDDYAVSLYVKAMLQLPASFTPTHETAGLPGFPAIDVFGKPGMTVAAPADGKVSKLSGHDPDERGAPGGAYGWSIYLTVPHAVYFLTHFGSRFVELGQTVNAGDAIGTICNAAVAHMASSASHIHEGKHSL